MINQGIQHLKRFYWMLIGKNGINILMAIVRQQIIIVAAFTWRRLLINTTFIVVAGSVGKTTTKEFLAHTLAQKYRIMSTLGNHNSRKFKGLEATILRTRPWHKYAVVEVGMSTCGVMASSAKFLKPDIVIMLDVKRCHTNVFKTLEALAQEKNQIFKYLGDNGCAIINQDNAYIAEMMINPRAKVIRFGASEENDLQLLNAESNWPERLKLTLSAGAEIHEIETRLVGTHWVPTIMASIAAANYCGIPVVDAIQTIQSIEPLWARMQPIVLPTSGATILRDDFNGSIDTFEVAFKVLHDASASRKIMVVSDFSDSKKKLRSRANYLGRMGEKYADIAVFVGDYADRSVQAALAAGMSEQHTYGFFTVYEAIDYLKQELQQGDLVLIKGKTGHHLSRIYLGLIGPVKCAKLSCSKQLLCDRCSELGFEWRPEIQQYMATPDSGL